MRWTPKKTRIILVTLAILLDLGIGWMLADYWIMQKIVMVIGVVLVLAYVKAVDAKEEPISDGNKSTVRQSDENKA